MVKNNKTQNLSTSFWQPKISWKSWNWALNFESISYKRLRWLANSLVCMRRRRRRRSEWTGSPVTLVCCSHTRHVADSSWSSRKFKSVHSPTTSSAEFFFKSISRDVGSERSLVWGFPLSEAHVCGHTCFRPTPRPPRPPVIWSRDVT